MPASTSPVPAVASRALPVGLITGISPGGGDRRVPEPLSTTVAPKRAASSRAARRRSACTCGGVACPAAAPLRADAASAPWRAPRRRAAPQQRLQSGVGRDRVERIGIEHQRAARSTARAAAARARRRRRRSRRPRSCRAGRAPRGSRNISSGCGGVERRRARASSRRDVDAAGAGVQRGRCGQQRGAGHAGGAADHRDIAVAALVRGVRRAAPRRRAGQPGDRRARRRSHSPGRRTTPRPRRRGPAP